MEGRGCDHHRQPDGAEVSHGWKQRSRMCPPRSAARSSTASRSTSQPRSPRWIRPRRPTRAPSLERLGDPEAIAADAHERIGAKTSKTGKLTVALLWIGAVVGVFDLLMVSMSQVGPVEFAVLGRTRGSARRARTRASTPRTGNGLTITRRERRARHPANVWGSRAESSPNSLIRADGVTLIEAFVVYEAEQNDSNRHRATRRNAKLGHTPKSRRRRTRQSRLYSPFFSDSRWLRVRCPGQTESRRFRTDIRRTLSPRQQTCGLGEAPATS